MRHICVASADPEALAPFIAALAQSGCTVDCLPTAAAAASAVREKSPDLCVVDGDLPDSGALALVAGLLEIDARVTSAVISSLSDEAFHDIGEGLGILLRLPPTPGPAEAARLLAALEDISSPCINT